MIFTYRGFTPEHRKRPQRIFHTAAFFFQPDRMKNATKNGIISFVFNYFPVILGLWGVFGILEAIDYICDIIY